MTAPVFLVPEVISAGGKRLSLEEVASPGEVVHVDGNEGRHAAKAHRLQNGEEVDLVDGKGLRVRGAVVTGSGDTLAVEILNIQRTDLPLPRLVLVQALAKGGRDEQAVETATELGVDEVVPWAASRSVVRWNPQKAQAGRARWERIAAAATKQSRRDWTPSVAALETSADLTKRIREATNEGGIVLVLHESASTDFSATVAALGGVSDEGPSVTVVVGPEGGISEGELDQFRTAGALITRLGPHVMRSSTAGPAALVALQMTLGRW